MVCPSARGVFLLVIVVWQYFGATALIDDAHAVKQRDLPRGSYVDVPGMPRLLAVPGAASFAK